jgi:phospholipase D1/2
MKRKKQKSGGKRRPAWGKIAAAIVGIAALFALWRYTPLSDYLTGERISDWARVLRELPAAPLWVALVYVATSYIMFPRPVLTLITAIAFGPWLGFTYSMIGIMIAALSHYYVGRLLPKDTVQRIAGDNMKQVSARLKQHGFMAMFAVRVIPVAPFPVEGIIAGAMRLSIWDYSLGTFLGFLPGVLATMVFGREIERALKDASTINYWILGAVVLVFIAVTFFIGRWLTRSGHARA